MQKIKEQISQKVKSTILRFYAFNFLRNLHLFSAVLIPFFTKWGGISLTQTYLLQSWFSLWLFLLEVPTGAIADYFGRKYSLALGSTIIVFAALVYGSVPSLWIFLLGEFLFALSLAFISGADKALLYDSLKEVGREKESKKIFGYSHSIALLAMLFAAPMGSIIASNFGLNAPMLFSSIPFFLSVFVALSLREPQVSKKESESKRYLNIIQNGFQLFKKNGSLRILAFDAIAVSSIAYFVLWFYQVILEKINFPVSHYGIIHAVLIISEILVSSNFSLLEKIFKSGKKYLNAVTLLVALSFILVGLCPNIVTVILFVVLAGGFGYTRLEFSSAYYNRLIPSKQRATALSFVSMFRRLFLVFMNPAIGYIADQSISHALVILGGMAFILFIFSPLRKENLKD